MEAMGAQGLSRWLRLAVPNGLTIARVACGAAFPFAGEWERIALVLLASATDGIDGTAARWLGVSSRGGAFLDAAADKLFALAVLVAFVVDGTIPSWQVPFLLVRDVAVTGLTAAALLRHDRALVIEMGTHRLFGKAATALLFAWFLLLVVRPERDLLATAAFGLTAAANVLAAADYLHHRLPKFRTTPAHSA